MLAFDALYESVRALAPAHTGLAFSNADKIMAFEASTHLDIELTLNRFLTGHPLLGSWSSYYYSSLFFALTPVLLVWLWARRPESYARLRSALVLSTFVALLGYWMFPVAPPRFALAGRDRHDGEPEHPRRGQPAHDRRPDQQLRRHAEPARRLGDVGGRRPRDDAALALAAPGLDLSRAHDGGGPRDRQPLPARRDRRALRWCSSGVLATKGRARSHRLG